MSPDFQSSAPGHGASGSLSDSLISICIPTYKRPALLAELVDKCFHENWPNLELVIGDDSPDDRTEHMIASLPEAQRERIRYKHHAPSLGQNGNVNDLLHRASGSRLFLIHDDDLILPGSIEKLARLWEQCPTLDAAFGNHLLCEDDGTLLAPERSDALNVGYHRTAANAGRQPIPVIAGLLRMFPCDGFMVSTELARRVGFRPMAEVGDACDVDFGMRLCAEARDVWYIDEPISIYRITTESIAKGSIVQPYTYDMLEGLQVPPAAQPMLDAARKQIIGGAITGFAFLGKPRRALQLFLSSDYPALQRFSPRGIYHLLRIARAAMKRA